MGEAPESTLRTFRLDADVIKGLEEEASKQGASVNGIACRILKKYVRIRTRLEPFGVMCLTKGDMVEIISGIDDDKVSKVASRVGGSIAKEIIVQLYGEPTLRNFCQFLNKIICGYQGWASYSEERKDGHLEVRLGHTMGQKWSTFLRRYIEAALSSVSHDEADFKYISAYSLIFDLKIAD